MFPFSTNGRISFTTTDLVKYFADHLTKTKFVIRRSIKVRIETGNFPELSIFKMNLDEHWPLLTPLGGFDFSVLKLADRNEIYNLRKRFKNQKFRYKERLPSWWEPETPGLSGKMTTFGDKPKESVDMCPQNI